MHRGLVVPVLDGITAASVRDGDAELVAQFGLAMLDAGVASPDLWTKIRAERRSPTVFVAEAVRAFVNRHGGEDVRRHFYLEVRIGTQGHMGLSAEDGEMLVTIEPCSAAYVRLGDMARKTEPLHPRLPVTVMRALDALGLLFRTYDIASAEELRVQWREGLGEDEFESFDENHRRVMLPPVLRRRPLGLDALARLAADSRAGALATRCLEVEQIARPLRGGVRNGGAAPEGFSYRDNVLGVQDMEIPAPVILVAVEDRDAICAAFDSEMEMESSGDGHAPSWAWPMQVTGESVRLVFRRVALAVTLVAAVARVMDLIQPPAPRRSKRRSAFIERGGYWDHHYGDGTRYAVPRRATLFGDAMGASACGGDVEPGEDPDDDFEDDLDEEAA